MKKITSLLAIVALGMTATPAIAAPAASKLSVAKTVRAGAPTGKSSRLAGENVGPIAAALIGAGIVAGTVLLIVDKEDDSDSN